MNMTPAVKKDQFQREWVACIHAYSQYSDSEKQTARKINELLSKAWVAYGKTWDFEAGVKLIEDSITTEAIKREAVERYMNHVNR